MTDKTRADKTVKGSTDNPHTRGFDFSSRVPDGDDKLRQVCDTCGWVHYVNPKIVAGAVIKWQGKIVLARRAIEPRKGFWTLPAGFMEERETAAGGAIREAMEEANAKIRIRDLLALYDVPHISQVQLMYRAELLDPDISAGIESLEVALFDFEEIPWKELAFPSVVWALRHDREVLDQDTIAPFGNPDLEDPQFHFHFER
jgi:ADP-ribose pyrophosphatase YjhB (NUDIX family)